MYRVQITAPRAPHPVDETVVAGMLAFCDVLGVERPGLDGIGESAENTYGLVVHVLPDPPK